MSLYFPDEPVAAATDRILRHTLFLALPGFLSLQDLFAIRKLCLDGLDGRKSVAELQTGLDEIAHRDQSGWRTGNLNAVKEQIEELKFLAKQQADFRLPRLAEN